MQETATETDPSTVSLQPYFPDTPLMRYTRAYYQDRMKVIDKRVGSVLDKLRDAGELENTFVFYFGDHGGVLPRSKGYAYESGLHVPLVIRVPDNFRELADRELGSRTRGFVEFVDFGPTVLSLADVEVPEGIDGKPFMGVDVDPAQIDSRDQTFGYADRFDEKYDLVRTLRIGNFKYVRNFEPFYPDALQNNYRYKALAFQQWRQLHQAGELSGATAHFFEPKSPEALYDLDADPHEVNNLAAAPEHQAKLLDMRAKLDDRLKSLPDLSFLTEGNVVDAAIGNPVNYGQTHIGDITRYIDTVNLALKPIGQATIELERALNDQDPWVRYWALVACTTLGKQVESLVPMIEKKLRDTEPLVVVRAVEYLAMFTEVPTDRQMLRSLQRATIEPEALRMMNSLVFLRDFHGYAIDPAEIEFYYVQVTKTGQLKRRLDYLNGKLDETKKPQ